MGNSKYLDNLSKDDYNKLSMKLWNIQNHKCFICGEDIDMDIQSTNIDHIKALVNGGKDNEMNFGLTHESCNKSKQDADLNVARVLYSLTKIIKKANEKGESPSLKHVLLFNGGSKYEFHYKIENGELFYSFGEMNDTNVRKSDIFIDSLSGEQTTFIKVPIEYLYHDELINPRGLNSSIDLLIKEFYKGNPQLHLSLARLDKNKIKIFDGQHKAVSQIMLGVRELVVRLFIDTNVDRLIETNTIAGSKLKQIAFDKSIVRQLHDTLYSERIKKYQQEHGLLRDNFNFSEKDLVDYFKSERRNIKQYIINSQKNAVTKNNSNKLQSYINFEGRGSDYPFSYSTFQKTILNIFINSNKILDTNIDYMADEGLNPRILEKEQLIKLCNIIAEELLIGRYDETIGTYRLENKISEGKGDFIPDDHLVACRLFKEEIMYNWVQYIRLLINQSFSFSGEMFDNENLFQQKIPDRLWDNIRKFLDNLRDLSLWKNRSLSSSVFGGKQSYEYWRFIFKNGKTSDGMALLAKPFNTIEMIN